MGVPIWRQVGSGVLCHYHAAEKNRYDAGELKCLRDHVGQEGEEDDNHGFQRAVGIGKISGLEQHAAHNRSEDPAKHGAKEDDEEGEDPHANAAWHIGVQEATHGAVQHDGHGVIQDALPKHNTVHVHVCSKPLKHGKHSDRVCCRDDGAKQHGFEEAQGVAHLGQAGHPHDHGNAHGRNECPSERQSANGPNVVQERLDVEREASFKNDGRKKHKEEEVVLEGHDSKKGVIFGGEADDDPDKHAQQEGHPSLAQPKHPLALKHMGYEEGCHQEKDLSEEPKADPRLLLGLIWLVHGCDVDHLQGLLQQVPHSRSHGTLVSTRY
mmetsp:Transcript_11277/g.31975  ORF Transcript_11277/g.31975 Transcript_11277/m.31975 type:complete len:324 (+) Transcript_11277:1009-1980(+)